MYACGTVHELAKTLLIIFRFQIVKIPEPLLNNAIVQFFEKEPD
jgi:hypothetical protein